MVFRNNVPLVLIVILGLGGSACADDWPCWLGPHHDGKSLDKGLLKEWPKEGPPKLWKAGGIGQGYSSVTVVGGKVYITGDDKGKAHLSAFDMEGKLLWQVECGKEWKDGCNCSPTVDKGNVYTLDAYGLLTCFDAETGKKKWSREAQDKELAGHPGQWGYTESPLILDDWLIFKPGEKNCIVALEKTTGKEVWKSKGFMAGPEYSSCTPFVHDNVPYIVTGTNKGMVCVKAKTGELAWKTAFSADNIANCPTPLYSDGYVFWANGYGKGGICMKLEPDGTAKEAWKTHDMDCKHGGFIIDNGFIYGDNNTGFACVELKTGKTMWKERGVGRGTLCWADGMLYLLAEAEGQAALATCSPEGLKITGKVKVEFKGPNQKNLSWAHPVVAGGRLYLRYGDNLYCFDVKAK